MKNLFLKQTYIYIIIFLSINLNSFAQVTKGESPFETERTMQEEFTKTLGSDITKATASIPVGNSINSDFYYLGPGDVLSITINPIQPYPATVQVTPSSSIIIPRFGVFNVQNMTISQAKDTILKELLKRNPNITVDISLQKARMSMVNIKGNLLFPNIYVMPSSFQVSTAINYANKINSAEISQSQFGAVNKYNELNKEKFKAFNEGKISPVSQFSSRNILLLRPDGSAISVDIEKSKINNDPSLNPYVREGDEIIIPFEKNEYPQISIAGEVNRPITLPYKRGDSVSTLLRFGYGFTQDADLNNVKLYSNNQTINLEVDKNGKLLSQDFPISEGSLIIVNSKTKPQNFQPRVVSVYGEVNNPGVYVLDDNSNLVKDVITKAGGLTKNAYLPLANIYRYNAVSDFKMDLTREFSEAFRYSNLTLEDTTRFLIDMNYPQNFVSCDFSKLFEQNDSSNNVELKTGDIVYIPSQPKEVYVFGQVKNPGFVAYVPNKTMDYYIEKAGGYSDGGIKKRARIIRGRNQIWDKPGEGVFVNAGDQVYVPREPDIPIWLQIQKWGAYAAILGAAVTFFNLLYGIYLNSIQNKKK